MLPKEFYYNWRWNLKATPETLWPYVSDTNRFNRDTTLPTISILSKGDEGLVNARQRLRFTRLGIPVEWLEEPFEWSYPRRFGVIRHYERGPVKQMKVLLNLNGLHDGTTELVYRVWVSPRNLLGWLAIPGQVGFLSRYYFGKAFKKYARLAAANKSFLDDKAGIRFASGGKARLELGRTRLLEKDFDSYAVGRLVETIEHMDDIGVSRLRPYELADRWGLKRRPILELFLWATRVGLLDFRWDLLCPLCRGVKLSGGSLREVQSAVHCDTCKIDYTVSFDRSVELTFRPNPSIRQIEVNEYCVGGPQVTPHILAQQLLKAGETRPIQLSLDEGRFRVRVNSVKGGQYFRVTSSGVSSCKFSSGVKGWPETEPEVTGEPDLIFFNDDIIEHLFILERVAWDDKAVTAAEVTGLQLFRDLFSSEALRPGEQISVGSITVVFTDLRGSTRLYRQIGDAPAFGRVMNHFDLLKEVIAAENGALVKTIGDAVMAVFQCPADALRAMLKAQQRLRDLTPGGMDPFALKAGIHTGPCIAVTLNDRLDYFGTTVNLAARLESFSSGQDIIISQEVRNDPEISKMLDGASRAECFEANLKGFDEESFSLCRVPGYLGASSLLTSIS
jgi:class 3 adenylate cyclase